jgi:hypothetical protein
MTELHRVGIKFFVEEPVMLELPEVIPVFHRWIQTAAVDGVLIDVADYSHVPNGPGILLIGHEANYSMDATGARLGLAYYRKRPGEPTLAERLRAAARSALGACRALETTPELEGRVHFRDDEVLLFANDRLLAPNDDETYEALRPHFGRFLDTLFAGENFTISREPDRQERFSVTARAAANDGVAGLLGRLAA